MMIKMYCLKFLSKHHQTVRVVIVTSLFWLIANLVFISIATRGNYGQQQDDDRLMLEDYYGVHHVGRKKEGRLIDLTFIPKK